MRQLRALLVYAALSALPALAAAAGLPATVTPQAPFPHILTDASEIEEISPGVSFGSYELRTVEGPLSLHVLAIEPRAADIRIESVLASDRLISGGETVSSMARRSGAIAGINGDYFDIGNTNEPVNIVVRGGRLLRTPIQRYALSVSKARAVLLSEFVFAGSVLMPDGNRVPLGAVNVWPPPHGGVALFTPEYGAIRPHENLTLVALAPLGNGAPFTSYRVSAIADNTAEQPAGYYLGIGLDAYDAAGVPNVGDTLEATDASTPPLRDVSTAIGGGPLLVRGGAPFMDPDGPGGREFQSRIPSSGAAITLDGRLLLFEVDGRQADRSVGLTRAQFAAAMIAFGARDGMAFDGGGSSVIVARRPGDREPEVRNSPSDGIERKVADGLFIYNDAPPGPASRLVVYPQTVRAFVGARVPLRVTAIDRAGHPATASGTQVEQIAPGLATVDAGVLIAGSHPGSGTLTVERGHLTAAVPVRIVDEAARVVIEPHSPNVEQNGRIRLAVRAFDSAGYPIALPQDVQWSASGGKISADGTWLAQQDDAVVRVRLGRSSAETRVTVGRHEETLQIGSALHFETSPRGGPGSMSLGQPCEGCITLEYDFTGEERAAYATGRVALPDGALALEMDVLGDGKGEVLRLAIDNAIEERVTFTAAHVTWSGWRHISVNLPASLAQPAVLHSIYVVNAVAGAPLHDPGSLALRNIRVVLAGRGREGNKTGL